MESVSNHPALHHLSSLETSIRKLDSTFHSQSNHMVNWCGMSILAQQSNVFTREVDISNDVRGNKRTQFRFISLDCTRLSIRLEMCIIICIHIIKYNVREIFIFGFQSSLTIKQHSASPMHPCIKEWDCNELFRNNLSTTHKVGILGLCTLYPPQKPHLHWYVVVAVDCSDLYMKKWRCSMCRALHSALLLDSMLLGLRSECPTRGRILYDQNF